LTREPKIRELRVTDIRCTAERCGAGPGELCMYRFGKPGRLVFAQELGWTHQSRIDEHTELIAAGWKWQEVDPRDPGERGNRQRES
jgi:hypothetical protein